MKTKTTAAPATKLDAKFLSAVRPSINEVWQYIGSDLDQCCREQGERLKNNDAIEACIDANRLTDCTHQKRGAAAEALVTAAIERHGLDNVMRFLNRNIRLV